MANTSSPFLRLPAEVRSLIYEFVIGGSSLHVKTNCHCPGFDDRSECKCNGFRFHPCRSELSEIETQEKFNNSTTADYIKHANRHWLCTRSEEGNSTIWVNSDLAGVSLDLSLLLSCRRLYHGAKDALYGKVTFSFAWPETLRRFLYDLQQASPSNTLLIRRLHLDMTVRCKSDEDEWNAPLRLVSEKLTSLKTISVGIDQKFPYDEATAFGSYKNPNKEGNTFLRALRELEELPLTTGTIAVFSSGISSRKGPLPYSTACQSGDPGGWVHADR